MKRLDPALVVTALCAVLGACDGGLTDPATANRSAAPDAVQGGGTVTTQNIGTIGSGHRDDLVVTQYNGGTIGSGHRDGTGVDTTTVTTRNGGTIGSGH